MRIKTPVIVAATAALAFALPAHADEGLGVRTQFGSITSSSDGLTTLPTTPEWVAGLCHYIGTANLSGSLDFQYGGEALAGSTTTNQPLITSITCTLTSPSLGLPGEVPTKTSSWRVNCLVGGPCVGATSVSAWPARPVLICVDGYAYFGGTAGTIDIVHACKGATL